MRSAGAREIPNKANAPSAVRYGAMSRDSSEVSRCYFEGLTLVILILLFSVSFWNFTVTLWLV